MTSNITQKQRFDISLEDLQTFLVVAELRSFSRAAQKLSLSQPSVSNRVRRLEEKLAVRLLTRTTRNVVMTPDGERLHRQASAALRDLQLLCQEFSVQADIGRHRVDIAATPMVSTVALPAIIRSFNDRHPELTVRLRDSNTSEAFEAVLDGQCDLAVMVLGQQRSDIDFELLIEDECVVVTPLKHPLLKKRAVTLAEALNYPLLSMDLHIALRQVVLAEAGKRGLKVDLASQALRVSSTMTLLAMAAAGLGVCIHPRSLIPTEFLPTVGYVKLRDCRIIRAFGIVTAHGRELSVAARTFRNFLRTTIAKNGGWS